MVVTVSLARPGDSNGSGDGVCSVGRSRWRSGAGSTGLVQRCGGARFTHTSFVVVTLQSAAVSCVPCGAALLLLMMMVVVLMRRRADGRWQSHAKSKYGGVARAKTTGMRRGWHSSTAVL